MEITLVGRGEEILKCLKARGIETLPAGVEIAHADDVVDMHDNPSTVMHQRKNSSMLIGLKMLHDGGYDAMVSAGSTGALLTAATLMVRRVKGHPAGGTGPVLPNDNGGTVLIDCGANAECMPEYLLQFGFMGSIYAKCILGKPEPKVGLLNIGAEDTKGTPLQLEAYRPAAGGGRAGAFALRGQCRGKRCPPGCRGRRRGGRFFWQYSPQEHRGDGNVYGPHDEGHVHPEPLEQAGLSAL